jgi:hypothetical protein
MTTATKTKRPLAVRETQSLIMVRCITRIVGARKFTFWQADGCQKWIGRGCHMKAMSDAVRNAPVVTTTGKS